MRTCDHPSPDRSRQTARIAEYAAKAVRRQDKISPPDGEDFGRCAPVGARRYRPCTRRSEEHTSELQSLMRISYAVFCLKKKKEPEQKQHYTLYIHQQYNTSRFLNARPLTHNSTSY